MSVESMSRVLNHSTLTGTDKVILLGIANHEGDGGAWPSIATLMRYGNCSESTVHRAIRAAVAAGELEVVTNGGGTGRSDRRPNLYRVLLNDGVSRAAPREPDGVSRGVTGDGHGVSHVAPEPSLNHPSSAPLGPPEGGDGQTALVAVEEPVVKRVRRDRSTPLPDTWQPPAASWPFAREQLPGMDLQLVLDAFVSHAQANDRRQVNWDAAWRQWIVNEARFQKRGRRA